MTWRTVTRKTEQMEDKNIKIYPTDTILEMEGRWN
jgi:hypothetical protein